MMHILTRLLRVFLKQDQAQTKKGRKTRQLYVVPIYQVLAWYRYWHCLFEAIYRMTSFRYRIPMEPQFFGLYNFGWRMLSSSVPIEKLYIIVPSLSVCLWPSPTNLCLVAVCVFIHQFFTFLLPRKVAKHASLSYSICSQPRSITIFRKFQRSNVESYLRIMSKPCYYYKKYQLTLPKASAPGRRIGTSLAGLTRQLLFVTKAVIVPAEKLLWLKQKNYTTLYICWIFLDRMKINVVWP